MIYTALHNRWLRLLGAIFGQLLFALSLNLFIVPLHLYTGGVMGLCQLLRTLMSDYMGVNFGQYDVAGILYFIVNIPILLIAWRSLGRGLVVRTLICTLAYSLFYSIIPVPTAPIIDDMLTSCLLGGIISGVASGIVLTCGCSSGGLDVVGLCLSAKGSNITVGRFSLGFNAVLYAAFLMLFSPEIAIYSVIYNYFSAIVLDRLHQQNVSMQAMIFTKGDEKKLSQFIIQSFGRSVTYWTGTGAYTGEKCNVLYVCLSKYEVEELRRAVHSMDPHAFFVFQSGIQVDGNFRRNLGN
ncbi:YitT family protein [Oscillibacter sp.]|uniref:YitT family protein n=1 Tax=Oscillibacter sp. TaxID=1945593 RepID=UPI0033968146